MTSNDGQKQLRAAWDDLIQSLQDARDGIDQPSLMPATQSDRNLAEGYRYLMGFVHWAVERAFHEDPKRPHFRNALSIMNRSTIDNADAIYFYAPVDGRERYLLRGEAPAGPGRQTPHYLIFEASWGGLSGDSGDLSELRPGMKSQTGRIDSSTLEVESDGSFDILFAPERPDGFKGNFVSTLKVEGRPHPTDPELPAERYADYVSGRQIFNDWEREEPVHFEMTQLGAEGTSPGPYTPERAAREIRRMGELVKHHMHFWNAFWTIPMGTYGEREGSLPGVAFPRNGFNKMNSASGATGGGMSTNLYSGGVAELEPDEALIIESRIQLAPQYIGFQLGNLWGESIEYANNVGSRNGHQTRVDDDGLIRLVVAHEDPGVPNWLDTTGHREVFLTPRWAYSVTPPTDQWPTISARKVPFSQIRANLPENTPTVTPEERRLEIAIRQRHVRKRFRAF